MKKNYMKPALRVVRIQQKCQILSGSVTSVESGMKRKDYQKPTMRVVKLQHRTCMLAGSPLTSTSTNLDEEDDIDISDTPGSIWGR